jgi:hypothetical protein
MTTIPYLTRTTARHTTFPFYRWRFNNNKTTIIWRSYVYTNTMCVTYIHFVCALQYWVWNVYFQLVFLILYFKYVVDCCCSKYNQRTQERRRKNVTVYVLYTNSLRVTATGLHTFTSIPSRTNIITFLVKQYTNMSSFLGKVYTQRGRRRYIMYSPT